MPKARALMNVPATANRVIVPRLQIKEKDCNYECWCYAAGQLTSSESIQETESTGTQEALLSCRESSLPFAAG